MRIGWVALLLALAGCDDGRGRTFETNRELNEYVGRATCALTLRCNPQVNQDLDGCVSVYVEGVCNQSEDCDAAPTVSADQVEACVRELDEHTCEPMPFVRCDGVLK